MRSIAAAAIQSSPDTDPHPPNPRFAAIAADRLSQASAKARRSGLAPSAAGGRNPSPSMTGRWALPTSAASRPGLPSSRARLRRITGEDAARRRASSLLSHADAQRAGAVFALPVPTSPMSASGDSRPMPSGHDTADQPWPSKVLGAGSAQRPSSAARLEASRPGLSASRWPVRYSTCLGVPGPGHSSRTILNMLMAFDTGAKAPDELLLIATHAAKAALDFNNNPINQLNYWQAVARKRSLTEDEKDMLAELEEGCHDNDAISAACGSLIGDERRARIAMRQMSPGRRSEFNSQPIARFLGNQGSDS